MNKKQIAVNTHLFFLGVFFLIILGIFEAVVRAEEIGLSIGFGFFSVEHRCKDTLKTI